MKKTFVLLLITTMGLISACKKEPQQFDRLKLQDSYWEGILDVYSGGVNTEYEIKINFTADEYGSFTYLEQNNTVRQSGSFEYKIQDKSLSLDFGVNNIIAGHWIIKSSDASIIEMTRNIENPENASHIKIKKIN